MQLCNAYMISAQWNADAQITKMILRNQVKELAFLGHYIPIDYRYQLCDNRHEIFLWQIDRAFNTDDGRPNQVLRDASAEAGKASNLVI